MSTEWRPRDGRGPNRDEETEIGSRARSDHATMEGALVTGAVTGGLLGALSASVVGAIAGALAGAAVGAAAERVLHGALHDRGSPGQDVYGSGTGRGVDHPARLQLPTGTQPAEFVDATNGNLPGEQDRPPAQSDSTRR
jgi:hypothetical protein